MKIVAYLVRTRLWVGMAAGAMTFSSSCLLQEPVSVVLILQVIFFTRVAYLFLDREEFVGRKLAIYSSLTFSFLLFFLGSPIPILFIIIPGLIVLFYQTDWMKSFGWYNTIELRRMPVIKNVAIAVCWTIFTSMVVRWNGEIQLTDIKIFIAVFLLVFALSIAEDIADSTADGFDTIAKANGLRKTKLLALCVLLIASFALLFQTQELMTQCINAITILLAMVLVTFIQPAGNRYLKGLLIDGVMVLHGLMFFLAGLL